MATISKAVVKSIKQYGDDVREYIIAPEKYNFFDPGTFLQLTLEEPKTNRWPESRNFSLASYLNDDKTIRIIIRKIGYYTNRIFDELTVGSSCYLKYSFGDFLLPFYDKENSIVCIAGGTGVAPFISFAEFLKSQGQDKRMHLFYSAKGLNELICHEEFKSFLPKENINIHFTREENPIFCKGRISLNDIFKSSYDIRKAHFYICGGEEFTKCFKEGLINAGAENVYTDEW